MAHTNERKVTDPITHLPLSIHDADSTELEHLPPPLSSPDYNDTHDTESAHADMEALVREATQGNWIEDPIGDQRRTRIQTSAVAAGAATMGALGGLVMWSFFTKSFGGVGFRVQFTWAGFFLAPFACITLGLGVGAASLLLGVWQHEPAKPPTQIRSRSKDATPQQETSESSPSKPESAQWLNSFLNSVWPIVNPSLFTSISDMLEDAMQATLPKMVLGVRVADIGQGSESVRVMGIRWLDAGSASEEVDGMKGEEGDFVNMEVALAYRAKETTAKGIRGRSANAHLLMEFLVSGGVTIPVWVELLGFLSTMRLRFQLTPNPPFLSLMTITLLGLPKVSLKCTPLAKNFLNVMDIPGLSNWLQSSINLAVTEYVAPRSLTMDLKTLLMGRPKMDTDALGVVVLTICRASDFDQGDGEKLFKSKEGKYGDAYVTIGWGRWGKPLWSTRIISAARPVWEETAMLLVGPSELNSQESLQLQLWDSDRYTADDLLGEVEVSLEDLMSHDTQNAFADRSDSLVNKQGEQIPGELCWSVGYFAKTTFEQHLEHKQKDAQVIVEEIQQAAEDKLREAKARDEHGEADEVEQQKKEDLKETADEIISTSKPTSEWPSGILSIRIEQISGLEVEKVRESGVRVDEEGDDEGDLPSAYCTIMINQQRVYKTRTKMKSNNPFFDAGTEKFVRDWTNTDVIISVRDNRIHENDPVIGIVVLPLRDVFRHKSMFNDSVPLVGGIGYGRMRLALTFRSVQLKLQKQLLGWDVGTIEVMPHITCSSLPEEFSGCRLKVRTLWGRGKMHPSHEGGWEQRHGEPIRLPVKKRYASCLLIQLRKRVLGPDQTPAYATLWLKDIPDDEEVTVKLPLHKNDGNETLVCGRQNATQDIGESVGELQVKLRFWSGLSGYHKHLAEHDQNLADIMEVLDYAEGEHDSSREILADGGDTDVADASSDSSDESSSTPESDGGGILKRPDSLMPRGLAKKDGIHGQFADLKRKKDELHKRHRGLLQWKGARNVAWVGKVVEDFSKDAADKAKSTFRHNEKETGIEKEV